MSRFEIEIKISVKDRQQVLEKLQKMGFQKKTEIIEEDMYFNSDHYDIKKRDEALRIRKSTYIAENRTTAQINFKGPKIDKISMSRIEYETDIKDAKSMENILQALGFQPVAGVEKVRCYLERDGMAACVDCVKGLGDFLELEVLTEEEGQREKNLRKMDKVLEELGYFIKDTVRSSYLSMLMQERDDGKIIDICLC